MKDELNARDAGVCGDDGRTDGVSWDEYRTPRARGVDVEGVEGWG